MAKKITNKTSAVQMLSDKSQSGLYKNTITITPRGSVTISDALYENVKPLNPTLFDVTVVTDSFPIDTPEDVMAVVGSLPSGGAGGASGVQEVPGHFGGVVCPGEPVLPGGDPALEG